MNARRAKLLLHLLVSAAIAFSLLRTGQAQKPVAVHKPTIPRTWDEEALAELEVPLADPSHSPKDISVDDYYRIPVRPIYKSYPKYDPDKEPAVTGNGSRQHEPIVLWDDGVHRPRLLTEADWITAGEMVFNAPVLFSPATVESRREACLCREDRRQLVRQERHQLVFNLRRS